MMKFYPQFSIHRFQNRFKPILLILILSSFLIFNSANAQKQMERLGRGVVAVRSSASQVFVSWRMLGTDPASIAFNLYRGATKLNTTPITTSTNYVDDTSENGIYTVRPVINGAEQAASAPAEVWAQQYLSVSIQRPQGGTTPDTVSYIYNANDCSVGDMDGDGEYEIIVKWDPSNSKDNAQGGYTGNVYLDAYKLNGTKLWRIDLGRNIRAGAHYTQFMVYDLDGDGKAEVACKTADGTIDGVGTVIGNKDADYRTKNGYILSGPEFLTIFNGQTGAAMATSDYLPARGTVASWGDNYGNRVDRFTACVAYLDGKRPSLVMGRGYYTRLVRAAWDWRGGKLTQRWVFDSDVAGNGTYRGQGNHQLTVGDVDGDGKDEVCNGPSIIDDNGTGLYVNKLGHGDALHMSDMDPDLPGLEVWQCHEDQSAYGVYGGEFRDAKTGVPLWGVQTTGDVGRAMAADIDPAHKGYECWISSSTNLYNCKGAQIATAHPSVNFGIWWDGDLLREILDGTKLDKWNAATASVNRLFTFYQYGTATQINGTKANPNLSADIIGDWREEAIYHSSDNTKLLIFTTVIPTEHRIYTLMHDPQYRMAIAWQNTAYNQPPHPGFYLGDGMSSLPQPNITTSIIVQENSNGFCSVEGTVDSNNGGFTGAGFANTNNAIGVGVNWKLNIPTSGQYTLTWNFANASTDRIAKLVINGVAVASNISFPSTASWTTWTENSVTVTLSAGVTNVRLEATTANGLANIDYFKIAGADPQAISCTSSIRMAANTTEISNLQKDNEVLAFPNPSKGAFLVKANGAFKFTIKDNFGHEREKGEGINQTLSGSNLIPGVYMLKVQTQEGSKNIKIIKQ